MWETRGLRGLLFAPSKAGCSLSRSVPPAQPCLDPEGSLWEVRVILPGSPLSSVVSG